MSRGQVQPPKVAESAQEESSLMLPVKVRNESDRLLFDESCALQKSGPLSVNTTTWSGRQCNFTLVDMLSKVHGQSHVEVETTMGTNSLTDF